MFMLENSRLISMDRVEDLIKLCQIYPNCEIEFEAHMGGVKTTYTIYSSEDDYILTPLEDFNEYLYTEDEILDYFKHQIITVHSLPVETDFTEDFIYRLNTYVV